MADSADKLSAVQSASFNDADWKASLLTDEKGRNVNAVANVLDILQNDPGWVGVLAYNEFTGVAIKRLEKGRVAPFSHFSEGEWTDFDSTLTSAWLARNYGLMRAEPYILPAMDAVSRMASFHPVRDWLQGLVWDGQPRAEKLLSEYFGAAETEYTRLVGVKYLIAAVARIMKPGIKVDNVLILEGAQGIKKSSGLRVLAGDEYFSDQKIHLKGDKDSLMALSGKWIFELAELDAFNKAESTEAKAFFAAVSDRFRAPYGKLMREVKRQCVFAGTTNQDEYFKDASGNRRYWPVFCTEVDLNGLQRDRAQLWAEALHLYQAKTPFWVEDHEKMLFEAEQARREIADPWCELIGSWLLEKHETTLAAIMIDCLKIDAGRIDDRGMTTRVGRCIKRIGGWTKVEVHRSGCRFVYRRENPCQDREDDEAL